MWFCLFCNKKGVLFFVTMEAWSAAMAIPPSAEECSLSTIARSAGKSLSSTPSSSTSGCISADDSCNDAKHMPPGLTPADLQLLLNSVSLPFVS